MNKIVSHIKDGIAQKYGIGIIKYYNKARTVELNIDGYIIQLDILDYDFRITYRLMWSAVTSDAGHMIMSSYLEKSVFPMFNSKIETFEEYCLRFVDALVYYINNEHTILLENRFGKKFMDMVKTDPLSYTNPSENYFSHVSFDENPTFSRACQKIYSDFVRKYAQLLI